MSSKRRVYFPKLKYPIVLSKHAELRMKQRAGLNTKKRRSEFMKKASKGVMTMSDIPRCNDEFSPFILYLRQVYKSVSKKNLFCMLYFYMKYILIVSVEGTVITFLTIDPQYEKMYNSIQKHNESLEFKEDQTLIHLDNNSSDSLNAETSG
jgi:hypothetical protein